MKIKLMDIDGVEIEVEARDLVNQGIQNPVIAHLRHLAREQGWLDKLGNKVSHPKTGVVIAQRMASIPGIGDVLMDIPSSEDLNSDSFKDFLRRKGMSEEDIDRLTS